MRRLLKNLGETPDGDWLFGLETVYPTSKRSQRPPSPPILAAHTLVQRFLLFESVIGMLAPVQGDVKNFSVDTKPNHKVDFARPISWSSLPTCDSLM